MVTKLQIVYNNGNNICFVLFWMNGDHFKLVTMK